MMSEETKDQNEEINDSQDQGVQDSDKEVVEPT
ncbi:MAG: hypothetical protein ACJAR8_001348, partial [Bacteroidia bacterium]